ncbi:hypothetical protein [Ruegeria arenilitoris]|uniref:hypothetical protein n=1 Tax=Ruegeria arenilitoris TaxID=1173585 RepID=UPI0014808AAD|nr:hypothetical protein [Ruegeria arenilitoris]
MSSKNRPPQIFKRRVFYIPGYDPFPPRRYRELYRKEGKEQAEISGYSISVSADSVSGSNNWHVTSVQEGVEVQTEFEVLPWSDIVQRSMSGSILVTYIQMARTVWTYVSTGVFWRLMRLRKGPVLAALYPVVMLILQLLIAILIALSIYALIDTYMGELAILPAALGAYCSLFWFRRIDNRLFAYYLLHDYAYSSRLRGVVSPELNDRLQLFSKRINEALSTELNEVLIVGHSSGAHLGVMALADVLRKHDGFRNSPSLSLLTLGQVIPMLAFLPKAHRLRKDLRDLSIGSNLTWVDVSAPGDGCTFALCDPVAVSGVARQEQKWPLVLSAAFTQTLSAERLKTLRWRFFRLHFQYLCAFDRPGDYDYFRITAGPLTLRKRFEGRAPSQSRITRTASKYTSVRA